MITVTAKTHEGRDQQVSLDKIPDRCPICNLHGRPEYIASRVIEGLQRYIGFMIFGCPADKCRSLFLARYSVFPGSNPMKGALQSLSLPMFTDLTQFPENIRNVSPAFCEIYDQANKAEVNNLDQICGPGYRKSLEFLIKDYLINHTHQADTDAQVKIKSWFLGKVIEEFVDEDRIKKFAKRAAWLGNDETHYVRKWETKDVSDLKSLIKITVNFVDLAIEAEAHLAEMPEPT
jgi:hypothetical protein